MEDHLLQLGLNQKEIKAYLALLEFGMQPASVLSKKLNLPKATVLFILNGLHKDGYIARSQRGRTQYFYADPEQFQKTKKKELANKNKALENVLPLLQEFKNPLTSPPKTLFFEGLDSCKKAYELVLESKTEVLEFATHDYLVKHFGEDFMEDFIHRRVKKKIKLHAICHSTKLNREMSKRKKKELREITLIPEKFGKMYTSILTFDDKVLILSLYSDPFAILLENKLLAETLKTVHRLASR